MSGPRYLDDVKFTTASTGTGTLTAGSAISGFRGLSVILDGDWGYFRRTSADGTEWENFRGQVGGSGTTLTRDEILDSSNAGTAVNFGVGTQTVFMGAPGRFFEQAAQVDSIEAYARFGSF